MRQPYPSLDEKAYIGGIIKCISQRIAEKDRAGFIHYAEKLKAEYPIAESSKKLPYHLLPEYAKKLSVYIEPLKSKEALELFAEELVLPPSVAYEIAISTENIEEAILDAMALDKVLHQATNIIILGGGKNTFIYSLDSTLNILRHLLQIDNSGALTQKGLSLLINNPTISQARINLHDLLSLDDYHLSILKDNECNTVGKSILGSIEVFDQQLAKISNQHDEFLDLANNSPRNKPDEQLKHAQPISMNTVRRLYGNGLKEYALSQIKKNALGIEYFSEADDLIDKFPRISKDVIQHSFSNYLEIFNNKSLRNSLGPYFKLAHKLGFELPVPEQSSAINYYMHGLTSYVSQEDPNKEIANWAPRFFDDSFKGESDRFIRQHRLIDKVPYAIAVASNRLKRMMLENELGM